MFKKSLVALALVTASTGAFAAADIKTASEAAAIEFSIEGSASKSEVLAGDVTVVLGAEYSIGDILTFTFVGGDVDTDTALSTYTTSTGAAAVTIGLLNSSSSSLTYRVTEIDTVLAVTTIDEEIVLAGLEFDRDSVVASGKVVVTYAAETSTAVSIDSGTKSSATIIEATNQFTLDTVVKLNAVIDVEAQRLTFTGAAETDTGSVTTLSDGALTYPATAITFDHVLTGDFTFLDTDLDTAGIQLATSVTPVPDTVTATTMTFEDIATGASPIVIDTDEVDDTVIPTQGFTLSVTAKYTDHGTAEAAGTATDDATSVVNGALALGEWTLNGSVVNVPYLPFGPATQPIIRHTNIGSQTGDISLRYMVEGVDTAFVDAGVIVTQATPGVRNLLSIVSDALKADGYDASVAGFKVALEVTSNVPANDVTVFAAAKVTSSDSDRLTVGAFSN